MISQMLDVTAKETAMNVVCDVEIVTISKI